MHAGTELNLKRLFKSGYGYRLGGRAVHIAVGLFGECAFGLPAFCRQPDAMNKPDSTAVIGPG